MNYSVSELNELASQAQSGDGRAADKLVRKMMPLVKKVASSYARNVGNGEQYLSEYESEALVGLYKSLDTFNSASGSFYSYASNAMAMAIRDFITNRQNMIRFPKHNAETMSKVRKAVSEFEKLGVEEPTMKDIADKAGLSERVVTNAIHYRNLQNVYSLDFSYADSGDDKPLRLIDVCADNGSLEDEVASSDIMTRTESFIFTLPERERNILCSLTGAFGYKKQSVNSLASSYGVTAATIRNWNNAAKDRVKQAVGY